MPRKREEHGRLGRAETDPLARATPIRTMIYNALHRRRLRFGEAPVPLSKIPKGIGFGIKSHSTMSSNSLNDE